MRTNKLLILHMKFGSILVSPSLTKLPNYQGCNIEGKSFTFKCGDCQSVVSDNFALTNLDKDLVSKLVNIFDIPHVGKSHDGGWPNFQLSTCNECEKNYGIYTGINETSNSVYSLTLQGVIEIEN